MWSTKLNLRAIGADPVHFASNQVQLAQMFYHVLAAQLLKMTRREGPGPNIQIMNNRHTPHRSNIHSDRARKAVLATANIQNLSFHPSKR